MRKCIISGIIVLLVTLAFSAGTAVAGQAPDMTSGCTFETNGRTKDYGLLTDGDIASYFPFRESKGWLNVTCAEPVSGVYIQLFDKFGQPLRFDFQVRNGNDWETVATCGAHLNTWLRLDAPVSEFRILDTGKERLRISEMRVFGEGTKPPEVQDWQDMEKCDLMLLTAHPDDEILWFGGLLPTYAGERNLRVQNVIMVPTGGERKQELLAALWHCGVTAYPDFLYLVDKNAHEVSAQYSAWRGKNRVLGLVTEAVRKHKPEVVVTHGEKGEYGHGAHKAAADAALQVYKLSAKKSKFPKSAEAYGTWQIKKLYFHESGKNPVSCDWTLPLEAFGGKTGYEVGEEAFAFHASQIKRDWEFEIHGKYDNAVFDLRATEVGKDSGIGDLMEHIGTGTRE